MDCDAGRERLEALLDGELSPADAETVEAHLARCPDCRKRRDELTSLRELARAELRVEAPSDLRRSILDAAEARGLTGAEEVPGAASHPSPVRNRLTDWMRPRRLVPTLAAAGVLLAVMWQTLERSEPPEAFGRPGTVVAIRLGEIPGVSFQPARSAWTLGGTE